MGLTGNWPPEKTTAAPASQNVANANAPGQSSSGPASPSAVVTVPLFGGKRGGKTRQDGLVPGSPEAVEADRKKDRERKAAARAVAAQLVQPPPLPAATPGMVAAPVPPPAGEISSVGNSVDSVIPWQKDDLREIFEELIPTVEEGLNGKLLNKAQAANLPGSVVKEIAKDAAWGTTTKKGLIFGGAAVSAKYLNKAGISSEYKEELVFGLALARVANSHLQISRRLDALILEQRKANLAGQAEAHKK